MPESHGPMEAEEEHDWQPTGWIIDTAPPFPEEACAKCGAIAWGGHRDGFSTPKVCPNDPEVYREWHRLVIKAHNERAAWLHREVGPVVAAIGDEDAQREQKARWDRKREEYGPLELPSEWWVRAAGADQ